MAMLIIMNKGESGHESVSHSVVSNSLQTRANLWTVAHQTPLSMELPRKPRYTVRKEKKQIQFGTSDSPTYTHV